ncbi:30S ribosomal protein S17e [Candidatus Woesearchaeota archaeon]|nr:30S ribosomal protein S17e [Candidatus Woesearchaeota archaeon]
MGRIKTQLIKRTTNELLAKHRDKFSTDFSENKAKVQELTDMQSKKLRNTVAGYVTRQMKVER